MKKKEMYEAPLVEVFEVNLNSRILYTSDPNATRSDSASSGYDSNNELGLI